MSKFEVRNCAVGTVCASKRIEGGKRKNLVFHFRLESWSFSGEPKVDDVLKSGLMDNITDMVHVRGFFKIDIVDILGNLTRSESKSLYGSLEGDKITDQELDEMVAKNPLMHRIRPYAN